MFVLFTIRKISKDIVRMVRLHPHPIRADLRMVNSIRIRKFADADTRYSRILRMLPQPTSTSSLGSVPATIPQRQFKCIHTGCESSFKRKEGLTRHLTVHSGERPYVCWVPGCQRGFSRRDHLTAHHTTHGKQGGLNRYVATLDKTSPVYNPHFCGQLTPQGWPIGHAGHNSW